MKIKYVFYNEISNQITRRSSMKTVKNQVWVYNSDIDKEVCGEGIARKILAYSDNLMCADFI